MEEGKVSQDGISSLLVAAGNSGNPNLVDSKITPMVVDTYTAVESVESVGVQESLLVDSKVAPVVVDSVTVVESVDSQTPPPKARQSFLDSCNASSPPWQPTPTRKKTVELRPRLSPTVTSNNITDRIKKRFPKLVPRPELVEFISHITTDTTNPQPATEGSVLADRYVTALPLVFCTNLIYSLTLLKQLAVTTFNTKPKQQNFKPKQMNSRKPSIRPWDRGNIWGMPVESPSVPNISDPYQFWVVHLNGRRGPDYFQSISASDETTKKKKLLDALVIFFLRQFPSLHSDEEKNIREGFLANCETIYIAGFNATTQVTPASVAAIQFSASEQGSWISWLGVTAGCHQNFFIKGGVVPRTFRGMGLGMFLQTMV